MPAGDPVHRPGDFDLAGSWREIADEVDRKRMPLEVRAVCVPHGIGLLRMGCGGRLEVTGPAGVRDHLASIGRALVERYG